MMRNISKKYRFDYTIGEPLVNGGFVFRSYRRSVMGYCTVSAARKLWQQLQNKWAKPIRLSVQGGYVMGMDGFIPLTPESLESANRELCMKCLQYEVAQNGVSGRMVPAV